MQTQGRTLTLDQLISKAKSEKETASLTMDRLMQSIMAKIASEPSSPLRSEPSEFDILRDSFCPSKVEYKYCEYAEKRRRKLLPSAEGEIQFPGIMQKRGCIRTAGSASILGTRGMDRLLQSQTEESDITSDSGKTPPTGNCTASRPQKRSWVKTWDEIICQVCNGSDQDDRNMIFTCSVKPVRHPCHSNASLQCTRRATESAAAAPPRHLRPQTGSANSVFILARQEGQCGAHAARTSAEP